MSRLSIVMSALSGELQRQFRGLGISRADQVRRGWVVRTPGQGRGRRLWVRDIAGPAHQRGLVRLSVQLVELHGVREPERLRAMGANPDLVEDIFLQDSELVVIEYLDWEAPDEVS